MPIEIWFYYCLAVLVLTASPGPSSLLCLSKGVTAGWQSGVFTALGSLTAISLIMTLSFTGLGVVVTSSELVFNLIKWSGAAYLVYLGIQALRSRQENYQPFMHNEAGEPIRKQPLKKHYSNGFIVGASNPKAIVFFTALFPQFIDPAASMLGQFSVLASTFVVLELSWLLFYVWLGARSSQWIFSSGRARVFNRLTGGVFIGAGVLLSTSNRA